MFEFLGSVERLLADLYPYRVPVTIGALAVGVGLVVLAARRGWLRAAALQARKRPLMSAVVGIVALAVSLPVGWYLASPLWERTTLVEASPLTTAQELATPSTSPPSATATSASGAEPPRTQTAESFTPREVLRGEWIGADDFHFAEGRAQIIEAAHDQYVLRVEDFSVRNGPDLFVYLSPASDGYAEGGLNLGELRATDGSFNYDVPPGTDLSAYQSVVIWCEQFAVLFATATLVQP